MKVIRIIQFFLSAIFVWPAKFLYVLSSDNIRQLIDSDIKEMNIRTKQKIHRGLLYWLVFYPPYRNLFYFRIGRKSRLISWFLKPYPLFFIGVREKFEGNAYVLNHPYGTIINAKSIGYNFTICQLSTIGNKTHGKNDLVPTIGNNVSVGANVNIIGDIKIGNNVIIGAGTVVVKDVPDNCIVVGNPMRIIYKQN